MSLGESRSLFYINPSTSRHIQSGLGSPAKAKKYDAPSAATMNRAENVIGFLMAKSTSALTQIILSHLYIRDTGYLVRSRTAYGTYCSASPFGFP